MEGHSPFGCPTVLGELAYVAEGSLFLLGGGDVGSFPPDCTYPPCANFSVVHATVMVAGPSAVHSWRGGRRRAGPLRVGCRTPLREG